MATKKYLSLDRLEEYDSLLKAKIAEDIASGDSTTLASAKSYTNTEIGKITGGTTVVPEATHAVSADRATQLATARTITLTGDASGSVSFDGTKDVSITVAVADDSHNHTIANIDGLETALNGKASSTHNHDSVYDAKGAAADALASAKEYADNAATTVKNDLLNGAGTAYDTLKELGDLIDDNKDAIDALEEIASGKANATHSHAIADVTGLQSAIDELNTAIEGTKTDASNKDAVVLAEAQKGITAVQTALDTHDSNTTKHITSTERTNWNAAKTHADSAHAPSNAEKNQNAFSNIAVSGQTTVAADTATDTVTFAGSNVTITTDATNDKVTFTVADGSTSKKGVVQLTDSVSSTSTTTAATPKNVKAAYDLANTAKTNAATAQSKADSAYTLAEGKVDSLSDLGITATATELNYVDGVTSNIQTQIEDIKSDYFPLSGGVLSGSLTVIDNFNVNKTFDSVEYKTYVRPLNYALGDEYTTGMIHYNNGVNDSQFLFNKNGVAFRDNVNSKLYQLFGQHNAATAATSIRSNLYTYGTADMTAGTSTLETGKLYFVYE